MAKKQKAVVRQVRNLESVITLFIDGVAMYTAKEGLGMDEKISRLEATFQEMGYKTKTHISLWIE